MVNKYDDFQSALQTLYWQVILGHNLATAGALWAAYWEGNDDGTRGCAQGPRDCYPPKVAEYKETFPAHWMSQK